MKNETVRLNRDELYELVWSEPMRTLAPRFGISDVALAKTCRKMHVPRPWRGYWQQIKAGKRVRRPRLSPLPSGSSPNLESVTFGPEPVRDDEEPQSGPVYEQETFEARPENEIIVSERLYHPHPLLKQTNDALMGSNVGRRDGLLYAWRREYLDVAVTKASLSRALRVMDALVKALEKRGYPVSIYKKRETSVEILGEKVTFRLREKLKQVKNEDPDRLWGPKYGYEPTGRLSFEITQYAPGVRKTWNDGKIQRVETCLNGVVVGLVAAAEAARERKIELEKRQREREEEARRRRERERRKKEERARRQELERQAEAWTNARRIREYIAAVRRAEEVENAGGDVEAWITWASAHADRLDPLTGEETMIDELTSVLDRD